MFQTDLILLHAPSVYDFRKKPVLYGPISDVIPSTQIFEMYPIGFMTLLGHLQRHGFRVRILNLALKMLRSRRLNVEKLIRKLHPLAFGIDLHWMVHAQGSLALAEIMKRDHPDIPIIFGGLSSSYYHAELIRYPQVDYIIRGDSAEEPLRRLMTAIKERRAPEEVPNLTWKHGDQIIVNASQPVPTHLNDLLLDYRSVMKSTVRYFDFSGHVPFQEWPSYPIVLGLSCRGCTQNCAICGGSAFAYRRSSERQSPSFRRPEMLAQDIAAAARYINGPTFVLGDLAQAGEEYVQGFLRAFKAARITNHIALEFFVPPSRTILEKIADVIPNFNIQISPETHDETMRQRCGRPYDNAALERMIADAQEVGCQRFDLFFLIGLSGQTPQSVRETVQYCRTLLDRFGRDRHQGWLHPYISPLAPFLDPGSLAFENPKKYGYRLFCTTLEEHRRALLAPSWKHTLNYETDWMSRDQIADSTYEAALSLNRLKVDYGLQHPTTAARIEQRILIEQETFRGIDAILASGADEQEQNTQIARLMRRLRYHGSAILCDAREMRWPVNLLRFRPFRILQGLLSRSGS